MSNFNWFLTNQWLLCWFLIDCLRCCFHAFSIMYTHGLSWWTSGFWTAADTGSHRCCRHRAQWNAQKEQSQSSQRERKCCRHDEFHIEWYICTAFISFYIEIPSSSKSKLVQATEHVLVRISRMCNYLLQKKTHSGTIFLFHYFDRRCSLMAHMKIPVYML